MQSDNRLLDDLARVATGALGTLQGVRDEVTVRLRDQFERVLADLDIVSREEFDAVKAMAAEARTQNEALAARVAALETALATTKAKGAGARKTAKPKAKTARRAGAAATAKKAAKMAPKKAAKRAAKKAGAGKRKARKT
jgi:BMFP domain-containing protein YqiC